MIGRVWIGIGGWFDWNMHQEPSFGFVWLIQRIQFSPVRPKMPKTITITLEQLRAI
jgi:hypothetical protein